MTLTVQSPPAPVYLTTEEIARRYNVNEDTARRWIRTGRLPGVRIGGAYRVRLEDLQRLEREGEDFTIETPIERPEVDALLQRLEDFAADVPDRQEVHEILAELRVALGTIPPERRILQQIEHLLHERLP